MKQMRKRQKTFLDRIYKIDGIERQGNFDGINGIFAKFTEWGRQLNRYYSSYRSHKSHPQPRQGMEFTASGLKVKNGMYALR